MIREKSDQHERSTPGVLSNHQADLRLQFLGTERDGDVIRVSANKCSIGSSQGCTLRLICPGVRPLHCLILRGPGGMAIRSWSPETLLNGREFGDSVLLPGDRLTIGSVEFTVLTEVPRVTADPQPIKPSAPHPPTSERDLRRVARRIHRLEEKITERQRTAENLLHQIQELAEQFQRSQQQAWHEILGQHRETPSVDLQTFWHKLEQVESRIDVQQQRYERDRQEWLNLSQNIADTLRTASSDQHVLLERSFQTFDERLQSLDQQFRAVLQREQDLGKQQVELEAARTKFQETVSQWESTRCQTEQQLDAAKAQFAADQHAWETDRQVEQRRLESWAQSLEQTSLTETPQAPSRIEQAQLDHETSHAIREELDTARHELVRRDQTIDGLQRELLAAQELLQQAQQVSTPIDRVELAQLESCQAELQRKLDRAQQSRDELQQHSEQLADQLHLLQREHQQLLDEQAQREGMQQAHQDELLQKKLELDQAFATLQRDQERLHEETTQATRSLEVQLRQREQEAASLRDQLEGERSRWQRERAELEDELESRVSQLESQLDRIQSPPSQTEFAPSPETHWSNERPDEPEPAPEFESPLRTLVLDSIAPQGKQEDHDDEATDNIDDSTEESDYVLPEEVSYSAPEEVAPIDTASILSRLGYQPVVDEAELDAQRAVPRYEPAPIAAEDEEGEDGSINDYMKQLIQRVSGGKSTYEPIVDTPTPASKSSKTKTEVTKEPTTVGPPLHASEFVPRAIAPEAKSSLKALRDVANSSTRSAINHHQRKRYEQLAMVSWFVAIVAVMVGGAAIVWMRQILSVPGFVGAVGFLISIYSVSRGLVYTAKAKFGQSGKNEISDNTEDDHDDSLPSLGNHGTNHLAEMLRGQSTITKQTKPASPIPANDDDANPPSELERNVPSRPVRGTESIEVTQNLTESTPSIPRGNRMKNDSLVLNSEAEELLKQLTSAASRAEI